MMEAMMSTKTRVNSAVAMGVEMMATKTNAMRALGLGVLACVMTGCGAGNVLMGSPEPVTPIQLGAMQGRVQGGQQAVNNATIQLYAAGKTGYGSSSSALISATVKTQPNGGFSITGDYTCPAGSQVYLTATGGDPGAGGTNANLAMMVALGTCNSTLSASQFIWVNEVTTVAAVYALAPFMSSMTAIGTTSTNATGLSQAFADANQLADTTNGNSPGPALPAGASLHADKVYTLANILATCVNSTGGAAGDNNPCGRLFTAATVGGSVPTDTVMAAMNIAQHPGVNVSALYGLPTGTAPFQPSLTAQPNDWTLAATYTVGAAPSSVALDSTGNVWVANKTGNSLMELGHNGAQVGSTLSAGISSPVSVAVAADNSVYVANSGTAAVAHYSSGGGALTSLSGGGLNTASGVAIDPAGMVWVSNGGADVLSEFNGTSPVAASGYTGTGIAKPLAVATSNF
jgi:hypothetical protein